MHSAGYTVETVGATLCEFGFGVFDYVSEILWEVRSENDPGFDPEADDD